MSDSNRWKPGSRPGGNAPAEKVSPGSTKTGPSSDDSDRLTGRIVHDERGNAVWDWVKDTARIAIDSTSRLLKRLEVPELKMEDTQNNELRVESNRDAGGGYNPYGGSAPARAGGANRSSSSGPGAARGGDRNTANAGNNRGSSTHSNLGGGYDPYGKSAIRKPTRKP
jgi:hypothetical protein